MARYTRGRLLGQKIWLFGKVLLTFMRYCDIRSAGKSTGPEKWVTSFNALCVALTGGSKHLF